MPEMYTKPPTYTKAQALFQMTPQTAKEACVKTSRYSSMLGHLQELGLVFAEIVDFKALCTDVFDDPRCTR